MAMAWQDKVEGNEKSGGELGRGQYPKSGGPIDPAGSNPPADWPKSPDGTFNGFNIGRDSSEKLGGGAMDRGQKAYDRGGDRKV